jgi:hypothetical protein
MLSVSRLYSVDDKMINEFAEVGGTARGNQIAGRKLASVPHRPAYVSCDFRGIEPVPTWREARGLTI